MKKARNQNQNQKNNHHNQSKKDINGFVKKHGPRKSKQLKFSDKKSRAGTKANLIELNLGYGGEINYRKVARPFSSQGSTHLVLRSHLLSGARSLLKQNRAQWVEDIIRKKAKKYFGSVYGISVNSNHIHLVTNFKTKEQQVKFLKDIAGTIALKIRRAFKLTKDSVVWDGRPFSKLYKKSAFKAILDYIKKNQNEAHGIWKYTPRPISKLEKILRSFQQMRILQEEKDLRAAK